MRASNWKARIGLVLLAAAVGGGAGCDRAGSEGGPRSGARVEIPAPAPVPQTNMILVRAGSFLRGNQRVTVSRDYWLGKFEVTQGDYAALMGSNPAHFNDDPRRPVEKVSQVQAVTFCDALTQRERAAGRLPAGWRYRLPTEAEWEYACRAGSTNLFAFGDDERQAEAYGWTEENSGGRTQPVGGKQPNAWGFHDMHGNVWEWCQDWFEEKSPTGDLHDPLGPPTGKFKVFRGGGWNHAAKFARCGNRFMMPPANGIFFVGFRVVLAP